MREYYDAVTADPANLDKTTWDLSEKDSSLTVGQKAKAVSGVNTVAVVNREGDRYKEVLDNQNGESFEIDDAKRKEHVRLYTEKEASYVEKALTADDYQVRQRHIKEDRERTKWQGDMGVGQTLLGMGVAGLFDPINLISFPVSALVKGSRISRAVKTGLAVAGENVAVESYLYQSDTQAQLTDIVMAGAMGGMFGTVVGALSKGVKSPDSMINTSHSLDESLSIDARNADNAIKANRVDAENSSTLAGTDVQRIKQDVSNMNQQFREESAGHMKAKQIDEALEELSDIEVRRTELANSRNLAPNQAKGLTKDDEIRLNKESADLDTRARALEQKLDLHERAVDARKAKKKWDSWSTKKKIQRMYGRETPSTLKASRMQKESLEASSLKEREGTVSYDGEKREALLSKAKADPKFNKKLGDLAKEKKALLKATKTDIETKFNCTVEE